MKLLVLDLTRRVDKIFFKHGYDVRLASDLDELVRRCKASANSFDAIVIGIDGTHAGSYAPRVVREVGCTIPIIGLSELAAYKKISADRAVFLEQGGDDLIYEPLTIREFEASLARISLRGNFQMKESAAKPRTKKVA